MSKWIFFLFLPLLNLEAGWLDRKAEGWAWYEDKKEKSNEPPASITSSEDIVDIRQILEEKLANAILHPTETNIKEYMIEQQKWIDQSAKFSELWVKTLLKYPSLDPTTTTNPVSQYGIQVQKQLSYEMRRKLIEDLARENGLFFFYEGKSKVSQAVSLVVTAFVQKYGWELVSISMDGVLLPDFPLSKLDNGISEQMNTSVIPSIYIVNPKSKNFVPIAYGLVTLDQIEKNIEIQFQEDN